MSNFGLKNLRIISPRDLHISFSEGNPVSLSQVDANIAGNFEWMDVAGRMSVGARAVLDNALFFADSASALADLHCVYATTARPRDMVKTVVTPETAAEQISNASLSHLKSGILFGPERTGLENREITMCNYILSIPTSPDYSSLNIAQSVVIVAYELFLQSRVLGCSSPQPSRKQGEALNAATNLATLATCGDLERLFHHLEEQLVAQNFFKAPEKQTGMMQNIRNMFIRANLTEQDVRTLHGIIKTLVRGY
jgi:tRNA/rRNA methyltransferase